MKANYCNIIIYPSCFLGCIWNSFDAASNKAERTLIIHVHLYMILLCLWFARACVCVCDRRCRGLTGVWSTKVRFSCCFFISFHCMIEYSSKQMLFLMIIMGVQECMTVSRKSCAMKGHWRCTKDFCRAGRDSVLGSLCFGSRTNRSVSRWDTVASECVRERGRERERARET